MRVRQIAVSELFRSIQGEGLLSGLDTLFVRLQGCTIGCVWCDSLLEGTLVRTINNKWIPIEQVKHGEQILGVSKDSHSHNSRYHYVKASASHLVNHIENKAVKLVFSDGTSITSTYNHQFFTRKTKSKNSIKNTNKWGYLEAEKLAIGDEFWSIGDTCVKTETDDFALGWLCGFDKGDGGWSNERKQKRRYETITNEIRDRLIGFHERLDIDYSILGNRKTSVDNIIYRIDSNFLYKQKKTKEFYRGFISGFFDAEGSNNGSQVVFSNNDAWLINYVIELLEKFDYKNINLIKSSNTYSLHVKLDSVDRFYFDTLFNYAKPHHTKWLFGDEGVRGSKGRKTIAKKVVTLVKKIPLKGEFRFYDIGSTSDNFIANGILVHNTKYTWKQLKKHNKPVTKLLTEITSIIGKNSQICFTGGEPLMQPQSLLWLIEKLNKKDYSNISIETCGHTQWNKQNKSFDLPDKKDLIDISEMGVFFSISPKLKSALGNRFDIAELSRLVYFWNALEIVNYKIQYKYVVGSEEDLDILDNLFSGTVINKHYVSIQIEESKMRQKNFYDKCVGFIEQYPFVRVGIQMHKILGMR